MANDDAGAKQHAGKRRTGEGGATKKMRLQWGVERVFLAWVRTAVALMAFGFLLAKIGALMQLLHVNVDTAQLSPRETATAGVILIGFGALVNIIATWRYLVTHRNISRGKYHENNAMLSIVVGIGLGVIGAFLVIYLIAAELV